jgi:mannose-1-phosphate guanylyltransferase/mannose-1-phosphate guanylyltransferase/mannose-6-phosphate isomerase
MAEPPPIVPVLLSGGSGSRLWPLSREAYPKQLLPLAGPRTMLQETALRVQDPSRFTAPIIIANEAHRFVIAEQLRAIEIGPGALVLEPFGRNTAAAAAVAALLAAETAPEGTLLLLPADHVILDRQAFLEAVDRALPAARAGRLVTFGIEPSSPQTGYGYIRTGAALPGLDGVHAVGAFVEKPALALARTYLEQGGHLWNSGLFLLPVQPLLAELRRLAPAALDACAEALARARRDLDFLRLDAEAFAKAPSISIDYALMERTALAAVVPSSFGWTDVGSWAALWEIGRKDAAGNVCLGDVLTEATRNAYIRTDGPLVATVGLDDVVVIATVDAVLVAARSRDQEVKTIVERLKRARRPEAVSHRRIFRPWGYYEGVDSGERFEVKRITIHPGQKISLQKHFNRSEHWVVVNGTALVTRDGEEMLLQENQSVYIPLGAVHRLANPGKTDLNLIEVRAGAYLGEDDIVRIEDMHAGA